MAHEPPSDICVSIDLYNTYVYIYIDRLCMWHFGYVPPKDTPKSSGQMSLERNTQAKGLMGICHRWT